MCNTYYMYIHIMCVSHITKYLYLEYIFLYIYISCVTGTPLTQVSQVYSKERREVISISQTGVSYSIIFFPIYLEKCHFEKLKYY